MTTRLGAMGSPELIERTVGVLAELAGGAALEMAVGTGRVALPLAAGASRSPASSYRPTWWRSSGEARR